MLLGRESGKLGEPLDRAGFQHGNEEPVGEAASDQRLVAGLFESRVQTHLGHFGAKLRTLCRAQGGDFRSRIPPRASRSSP